MAGALAMASAIEDFETQPRKRQRKDLPPVKTITNYYSPVPKPFSPPKTKILDYFSKTSPAGDKSSTSDQTKENGNKVPKSPGSSETPVKTQKLQRLKRGRRQGRPPSTSTAAEVGLPETPSPVVVISESSCSSDGVTVVAGTQGLGILGSETAALLAQISHNDCIMEGSPGKVDSPLASTLPKKCSRENLKKRGCEEPRLDEGFGSPVQLQDEASPGDKRNKGRAAAKPGRKSKGGLLKQGSSEAPECDGSVCDTSLESKEEEPDPLNSSTVVISFEDFLQSQNEQDGSTIVDTPDSKTEVVAVPCSPEIEPKPSQQVSPRTLTVQAEVHPVSPVLSLSGSTDKKLASIFTRKRGSEGRESKATESPPPPQETSVSPPGPVRRSNVVLPEEELELSVIESSSGPKCSQAERRQFMSAFRQAGLEGSRGKGRKVPGKQGEAGGGDAHPAEAERPEEVEQEQGQDKAPSPKLEQPKTAQKPGNKLRKSGRRKPLEEAVAPVSAEAGADSELSVVPEVGKEADSAVADGTPTSTPAGKGSVRRSARACLSSAPPALEQATPPPKPRSREGSKGQGVTEDCLAAEVTPKTHKPKHSVYRAEMLSPPDDKGSPIRMRLRRVFPNSARKSGDASDFEIRSPLTAQNPSESKNRKRAKKLVLKARELQQSKKTAVADTDNKRMLRTRDVPKSYCEDEDSIVCLSDVQKSPAPDARDEASGQKRLRSLNDVLGRNAAESKAAKNTTGPKVAAMFLGKKPQRPAAVISIFDDSSQEGSENSQDDEHFKARREFLKSGLPESFKRQIARTTASRDAYTLACASFQPVVHVLQRALDCPLWSLPWPVSPLLKHLNSTCRSPPRPLLSPGALDCVKIEPAVRAHTDRGSSWRQDFSEDIRKRLLEEIRASNPAFPVRRFFTWFLKKREEHLLRPVSADKVTQTPSPTDPPEACGKRKRRGDGEAVGKLPKRRRSARGEQEVVVITDDSPVGQTDPSAVVAPVGRARLRRARGGRLVQQGAVVAERTPVQNDAVIVLTDSPPPGNTDQDCAQEDVLWTEKYQPQHSSEVIGNSAAVRRLRCWLEEWKQRADREERRSHRERSQEDCSNDSWDCGDFQGEGGLEDGEEALCNTLLITGPPGVGKTAAVYACAQELGFKVFEVNASSQRSGRQILSQLKEATQSHQVDIQGVNAHKPAYFNSYSAGSTRPGASPKKLSSPRKVVSSPRRPQNSPCRKRGALAPTSLANFFKLSNKPKGRTTSTETHLPQNEAGPQKPSVTKKSVLKTREPPAKLSSDKKEPQTDEQSKKTATSLILFEEVDVIFDDDSGFLAAIKTFMTTTKRPVILTTNDPTFSAMFDGNFEEINFKMPSEVNVRSYLQLLCLAENVRTEAQDLSSLLCWNSCDIRRTLLHLQFWVRSGGRPGPPRPLPPLHPAEPAEGEAGPEDPVKPADEEKPLASSAPCDSGCTESLLGILNIDGTLGLSDMLKSHRCEELLVESWERRVDLLYSNMEELLPLPVCTRQAPLLSQQGALKPEPGSSAPPEDESPVKRSSRRRLSLKDRDLFESDSDSDDCFLSLPKLEKASNSEAPSAGADGSELAAAREEPPAGSGSCRQRKVDRSPEEQRSSELLSRCLGSLAEFMDHMSFLDSSVEHRRWQPEGACRPGAFGWAGAEVKSGLWDEARVEDGSGAGRESSAQIRAAVEGLSFRRCESSVSQVWAQAQELREDLGGESQLLNQLTLPVGPHRTALSVCQTSPCQPTVTQRRCEVMKTMLTSRAFCTLGNKSAAATDYLPFLRTVCRSERLKEQGKVKRRFLHYLDSIHLGLPKSTLQHLATEFP